VTELFLTYLLRSSVLLAFTLLLVQLPGLRRAGARDVLLKVALLASVASPFLPANFLPAIRLEPLVINRPATVPTLAPSSEEFSTSTMSDAAVSTRGKPERNQLTGLGWQSLPLVLISIGALINLVRFGRAWWVVRILLSKATPITRELCSELEVKARGHILCVPGISSPAAFGQHTIFIPKHLLKNLSKRQLQSVLAHETAHLRRRDPFWNAGLSLLVQLCFFQPLNFLTLNFWRRASEEICDAEAAKTTRNPLLLARTLLDIARHQDTLPALLTTSMVSTSHLSKRITLLLDAKETYMKRSHLILSSLLPILATLLLPLVTLAQNTEYTKTVVLDAGHGGTDLGAVGYGNEAEVTLSVAEKVRKLLEAQGINVVMTRQDDSFVELKNRAEIANQDADMLISLHANYADSPQLKGIETWIYSSSATEGVVLVYPNTTADTSKDAVEFKVDFAPADNSVDLLERKLAQNLQTELVAATRAQNRGTNESSFYILRKPQIPAVMIELGFVTNPEEGTKLATDAYQQTLAEAIARTLIAYLE
jgi:N-acetylmuramoyl-L-alanine amidase